ncbi:MAG: hypothetical protein ACRCXZ_06135 [Patescibacteria group bacterium]
MVLSTQPFEFAVFDSPLKKWIKKEKRNYPSASDSLTLNEIKLFDTQFTQIFRTLKLTPPCVADKFNKFEACLKHSQSIGSVCIKGLDRTEILSLGSPPQFLVLLPLDKFLIRPMNKVEFIDLALDLGFLAFTCIHTLELREKSCMEFWQVCLNQKFQTERQNSFQILLEFFEREYKINNIPQGYRGFFEP